MTVIIIIGLIILYTILLGFTWHNLNEMKPKMKIIYLLIGLALVFLVTLITFNISASGVHYEQENMISSVRNILVAVFMPVNGLILLPYIANTITKINNEEITKDKANKKMLVLAIIFVAILIFECNYLKSIQLGILDVLNNI